MLSPLLGYEHSYSFGKKCVAQTFSESNIFRFHPYPYRMRLKSEGLSHELNKCPPDTYLPFLRSGRSFESQLEQ